ncbi:TetR/AcrR family transcriptional regulator C-terminal domain-containing protein [Catellatospora coxensis]|uniref:TetR family transcriptional regulator n=1 Tax=Catellatospora coxensis TaxID=310354 RepID=A0A8J3P7X8_9ACTN|nr:TetR/AcrR family transcriptional regulator C-terminal domain-containing protein [Catellatospora coxensis]GIG06964.1 TetR family transcriptional regulator [Catellatospora coxensis]
MPRKRSLTTDQLAAAALAVVDRDGLAMLTMRAVAQELNMGTMSLYRYVSDREQLERLVVELVLGGVDFTVPDLPTWQERIAALCERIRLAVHAHPAMVPLLLVHRHASPGVRRSGEAMLSVLAGAGFSGERRVIAFRALVSYLIGALQAEGLGPLSGAGTDVLATLGEQHPHLAETAVSARDVSPQREFGEGLALLLRGLTA